MKKVLGTALALGATMIGAAAMASSANASVTYNVGVASDYVFRGVDQFGRNTRAEGFGGVDWASSDSRFYLGTWVSNTDTSFSFTNSNVEADVYGGWKPAVGPFTLDLGAIAYLYTDTSGVPGAAGDTSKASQFELKAGASVPLGGATLGAKVYWTPNFAGDYDGLNGNDGWYYEANIAYTFKNKATVSGAIGGVSVPDYVNDSYVTSNIGVTYPIMDHLSVDGRIYQNNSDAADFTGNSAEKNTKVVATLTASF